MRTDLARQILELSPGGSQTRIQKLWLRGYPSANPENFGPVDSPTRSALPTLLLDACLHLRELGILSSGEIEDRDPQRVEGLGDFRLQLAQLPEGVL